MTVKEFLLIHGVGLITSFFAYIWIAVSSMDWFGYDDDALVIATSLTIFLGGGLLWFWYLVWVIAMVSG